MLLFGWKVRVECGQPHETSHALHVRDVVSSIDGQPRPRGQELLRQEGRRRVEAAGIMMPEISSSTSGPPSRSGDRPVGTETGTLRPL